MSIAEKRWVSRPQHIVRQRVVELTRRPPRVPKRPWLQAVALSWSLLAACSPVMADHSILLRRPSHRVARRIALAENLNNAVNSVTANELKRHVEVLADDTFEGRQEGSRGGRAAGTYIMQHLERAGLKPAGDEGYFQPLPSGGRNILAVLPGRDPKLKQELILLGAHYDHVGYGTPTNSYGPTGFIHNGADDNASGVSALLEIVDSVKLLPTPRRSILIAFWDGEENGLLGSKHWTSQPTVPLDRLKLAINIDMVGQLKDNRLKVFGTRTAVGLRPLIAAQNSGGILLDFDWETKPNSDHYTFYERSIPFLMLHTGLHGNYHRPSDDAHLLNYDGMQQVTRLLLSTTVGIADRSEAWNFRHQSRSEHPGVKRQLEAALPSPPPRLGMSWRRDGAAGLPVTSITFGGAAQQAGLQIGDRVTKLNGQAVGTDQAFVLELLRAPTNSTLTFVRGEDTQNLPIRLQGAPTIAGFSWRDDIGNPGVVVLARVTPGGSAAIAGLEVGDRIYRVDGEPATTEELKSAIVDNHGVVSLEVERAGRTWSVNLN